MKNSLLLIVFLLSLFIPISCGKDKTNDKPKTSGNYVHVPDKKMCELLTKETLSSITGIAFSEEIVTLHQTDESAGKYVSQCGYYSDGADLGVLVRRFGNTSFPKDKEKIIGVSKTGDAELDAMLEAALATCKTIAGLGDAAYFYNLSGIYNLVVIFDDHYQVHISSSGKKLGFDDKTLEISKKVAIEVIKIFK